MRMPAGMAAVGGPSSNAMSGRRLPMSSIPNQNLVLNGPLVIMSATMCASSVGCVIVSSIANENIALSHPAVAKAAAIGVPHPKWDERPVLVVEPRPGMTVTPEDLCGHLEGRIARWWMPDEYLLVDAIPLGATGKINKLALRDQVRALLRARPT